MNEPRCPECLGTGMIRLNVQGFVDPYPCPKCHVEPDKDKRYNALSSARQLAEVREQFRIPEWRLATLPECLKLRPQFSKLARKRGNNPEAIYVCDGVCGSLSHYAMQYKEPGKWERWGIRLMPEAEISVSWSVMLAWLRPLIGDRAVIEVYPRNHDIVNTAPARWFWVIPSSGLPPEFDIQ